MKIETFSEIKSIAIAKWKEYRAALKFHKDNGSYADLAKAYNQLKSGRKLIDIFKIIQKGGVHENFHPKLAIAQATSKKVKCIYYRNGDVRFISARPKKYQWQEYKETVKDSILDKCLPHRGNNAEYTIDLEAPVPLIPPKAMPKKLTADYYILWEVDEWKMIPPTDPYLLKRITKRLFVVVAGWDLTELEKSVMAGRMY